METMNWRYSSDDEHLYKKPDEPKKKCTLYKCCKCTLITLVVIVIILFLLVFVIFPIIFMYNITLQTFLVFPNFDQPKNPEYNNFEKYGAEAVRNIYVSVYNEDNSTLISLGVWHLLPEPFKKLKNETIDFEEELRSSEYDVVLYFHGNSGTRIYPLPMYEVLREYFHVIAVDYRSYGDSTKAKLTELGVVNDLQQLYKWAQMKTSANIYVWGHSLGAALSAHTVKVLKAQGVKATGLILEAPFTTLREEGWAHPIGKVLSWLPWFTATILDPLERNGFHFKTTTNILDVDCPIMILHAEDDSIIPYTLGKKLAHVARTERDLTTQGNVTYHQFAAHLRYNHVHINRDPELLTYIKEFKTVCEEYLYTTISSA